MTRLRSTRAIHAWRHSFCSPGAAARVVALTALLMVIAGCGDAQQSAPQGQSGDHPAGVTRFDQELAQQHLPPAAAANPLDWVRFNYDTAHTGSVPQAQNLSAATIGGLHLLWRTKLSGVADSPAVYLHSLDFPDHKQHDVLYVDTRDGTLDAVDAATGHVLWSVHTGGPGWTTASPAADPQHRYVYFYGLDGYVHKVGAVDGQEIWTDGWPILLTKIPEHEKGSAPLDIVNGRLYAGTSTFAPEVPPNFGHLVVIDLGNGTTHVFNTVCSNIKHIIALNECPTSGGGIWARGSPVVDPATGNVFFATANGPFDGKRNWGDSVLELNADGTRLLDSYTPDDQVELDAENWDLGSTGPALLPQLPNSKTPYLLVQGGKDGIVRLLNRQNLSGQGGPGHIGGELQALPHPGCAMFNQPAVWQEPGKGAVWVFTADDCTLTGYQVVTDPQGATTLQQAWQLPVHTSSPLVAGGVLFAATKGALLGLDPLTGRQLWSSAQPSAAGSLGAIHWESPIVVGSKVYVSDETGALLAFGLG